MRDIDRDTALGIFMSILIARARDGVKQGVSSLLLNGPPGQNPDAKLMDLHVWFQQLRESDQTHLYQVVEQAIDSALFGVLVILDGVAGGYPIQGVISDFALYLQNYEDMNAQETDQPKTRVRLNPRGPMEDMHDIFQGSLQERKTQ